MPTSPPSPCTYPHCGVLVANGSRCPTHQPAPWTGSTHAQRRTLNGWQEQARARRVITRDNGICYLCHLPGADIADHVTPLAEGGTDEEANMRAAHQTPCHQAKSGKEAARGRARMRG